MKKHLLMFFVAVVATTMSLNARVILIDEGFENGIQEDVWTQEFVSGNTPWSVECEHLSWPSTAVQGSCRAYLRNTTGETEGYATRLISPVMDLRPTKVYMPELIFYYANPKWGADRDTLRVLYRTGERLPWKTLAEYSTASSDWQRVKISLPEAGKTYQIAFEGKDNLGRGIVLDSIKLQSAPECTVPYDLMATNKGAGKVNIAWMASFDADYYEVVVTKDTIDPDMLDEIEANTPDKIIYHGQVMDETNKDLTLEAGELYLLYVRSICGDEISSWSSELTEGMPFGFKVRTIKNVPFTENFNYPAGTIRDVDWVWGNNTQNTNPFVNSRASATAWAYYSPDVTSSVIFSGGETSKPEQAIPADRYVYLATPALADTLNEDFQVNQCQVHFWSTVYTYTGRQYGRSIIVGVMDDPDDITTFVPVDTVEVWGNKTFQENIVNLGSYQGAGAYVAFVSRFDRQNLFYLDNLTIEYYKNVNKVTKITVNPRDTYADISWEGNASSYNVLITNAEVDPANPTASAIVAQATVTTNSYRCTQLEANHSWNRPYYVYVLAAGTEWSYRYPFVTLAPQREIPYTFGFETSTTTKYTIPGMSGSFVTGLGVFGNNGTTYPAVLTDSKYAYSGLGSLFMSKRGGADTWITLPMVEDLSNVQVKFYLSGSNTFNQAHATIGIMSNPMDINTFVPVAHFTLNTEGYTRCYANFANYDGPDGVIAIVWDDVMKMSQNTINYIDEITVEELSDCVPPTNIELQIEPDSVTMRWEESSWDLWEVFLSRTALSETDRVHKTFEEIQAMRGVVLADSLQWNNSGAPQFGLGNLNPHATYYLYIRATCDPDWWSELSFATPCREEEFPFKETFEDYNIESTLAGCWELADYMGVGYPRIANAGTVGYPEKVLDLYSSGTIHRSVAILPAVAGNLSDMLLSFDVRTADGTASSSAVVYVGSMGDIEDQSTFVPFDTVYVSGAAFKKVRFILTNYNLRYENIAITTGLGSNLAMSSHVLIDNVELKDPSCIDAFDFVQTNFAPHSFDLSWSGVSDTDDWELKVLSANVSLNAIKADSYNHSLDVVRDTIVSGKSYHLEGLQALHTYYVYVRSLCGDSTWVATTAETSCELLDPTRANKETFDSYASGTGQIPNCWYGANADPEATSTYLPYLYSSTTYSNSGSNSFRMYASSSSYGPAYVVSPEIKCDSLSHIAVTFYMYASTSYRWVCGVMTDPTDLSTFVTIDSVQGRAESTQYSYDLSEYASIIPASAKYIAWRTPYNATSYAYLDDVSFVSVACPLTKPSISDLTTNGVRVSSGLRTNDPWILMITNTAISDANLAKENYVVPASQLVYRDTISRRSQLVNVLEAQTKYFVYTAALCDSTVMPQWNSLSFTTPCSSVAPEEMGTITFSDKEGFTTGTSGERPCWTVGSKTQNASSSYIPYVNNSSTYKHNDNNYLYFYDYVSSSASTVGGYAIMPELAVDSINKYQVTFWGRGNTGTSTNSQIIVGVVTDPSDLNTFVAVDTLNLSHTAWDPYSVGFENYEGDYMGDLGRNIMFLSDFGRTNYAYISEISVEPIPHCRPVQSFTVDSVGEDMAIISWKGYQDSYRMLLSDKLLTDDQKPLYNYLLDTIVDHSDEILLTNLNSTTQYYVYAQGICDGGDSTAISKTYAAFKTTCPTSGGVPLPLFEDFETYSSGTRDIGCWIMRGGSTYPQVVSANSNGSMAVDLYTTSTYASWLVLPTVDANLYDTKLSFDICPYGSTSTGRLYVGTIADPEDFSTFVAIDTFNTAEYAFEHHEMILADYELMYDRICFTSGAYQGSYIDVDIDNINLEYISTCNPPKMKFLGSSLESAELLLTPSKQDDAQWQVAVLTESQYNNAGDINRYLNAAPKITVDSTHIVLTGLTQASSYYVYARTVCDEGVVSSWMRTPVKFSTKFYFADGYSFGFEKSELWQRSPNSESDNYFLHPALVAGRDSIGAETQSYMYYPHSRTNDTTYHYSLQGTGVNNGALMMQARGEYFGGYIIFPAIDNAQARSFEFKVRPDYLDFGTKLPIAQTNAILEVGTIEKDKNFDTYQPLATIRLDALDANVIGGYTSKKKYGYSYFTLDLDAATVASKQIVLHMPKQSSDSTYICVDSVALGAPKGVSLVSLKKVTADGTSALVEWDNIGGPWNLVITNAATGLTAASFTNLSGVTSQLVENLDPQTDYIATLSGAAWPTAAKNFANASANATKLAFRTLCMPMDPNSNGTDFVWNFDNISEWEPNDVLAGEASDSLYFMPGCFHVGITYDAPVNGYQWLIQPKGYETSGPLSTYNASRHLEVGRNDSHALRIHTTEANFNSYIVLPELNCRFDTMMLEFYGRCFTNYDQTHNIASNRNKIADATYLNDAYSHSIVVGTLTDPSDFSTLQILDTLTYLQTELKAGDNVDNDPAGLRYWELKQMPLEFAQGKYIVLFQPAAGLFYIDDLAVKPVGNTLFPPTNTRTTNITSTSVTLAWNTHHPEYTTVIVLLDATGEEISRIQTTGTSYQLTDLTPAMNYQWYAFQTNGTNTSATTKPINFYTDCVVLTPDYTCGFEPAEGWMNIEGQKNYTQTLCWTYGDAAQGAWMNANYDPYNQENTKNYTYSYTGSNALMMHATTSSRITYQPYVALPAMDVTSYDTLQVMFWMRPAYISATNDSVIMSYTGSTYSKSVIVGSMTDPTDVSTFVPIDTVTYDGTLSVEDQATPENDYLFQQMKVELAGATGPYIALMTSFNEKGSKAQKTGDYIWIDDISFAHRQECKNPTELTELQIGTAHAVLTWNAIDSAATYFLQVSTDPFFAKEDAFVFNEAVDDTVWTVKGLQPLSTYVWRVQAQCGERWGESNFSQKATFKTNRSPYFLEEFTTTVSANEWTFSKAHADNVIDTTGIVSRGVDNWSFSRKSDNNGLQGPHYAAIGYNADYHWMITPTFYLPEDDSVHFSMDLALTACNTAHLATSNAITDNDVKDDYYVMIIVSEDGGDTWKSKNILAKWQNTNKPGMQLRDISSTGMRVRYSLAQYAGKNVRVGIYREARTTSNTGMVVHVDNVRFGYFDKTIEPATACQYEDVTINGITLNGEETEPGIHSYPTCFYATDAEARAGKRDSVQQLEIEVFPAQETFYADTICEGEQFTGYDFLPKTVTGIYHRKLLSMEHGCDSVVTLDLYVKPRKYAVDEEVAICQGESYFWNDKAYNRAGIFRDTLLSSIGCDSIMTLIVSYREDVNETVYDQSTVDITELPFTYENLLYPYAEGQAPIYYPENTAKGTYVDTVRVIGTACVTYLVHTLTVTDIHWDIDNIDADDANGARKVIYRDNLYIILNKEWYNAAGQKVSDPRK